VTSGSLSPCLDAGIGMGYVPVAAAEPGTAIEVDVRGKTRPAEVRDKPLYTKDNRAQPAEPAASPKKE
jgi:aminomethyltransferase